uniref:S-layer protein n=1 Tax=Geoglobus ahangari TaxID=113653 RepID=A0A7C4W4S7_9EURY
MKRLITILILLIILSKASALSYEDKPTVTAFISGSNHIPRGDYITIHVTVYNPAEKKKVDYFDREEAMFFYGREDMIFTAYNVKIELLGDDNIQVKTPSQFIPALPPMQPVTLSFIVKVSEDAKAGENELKMKVEFDRISYLSYLDTYTPQTVPVQKTVSGSNETVTYKYEMLTKRYRVQYDHESLEITLPVYVKEKDVKLEIVNVSAENIIGKGKGKLVIEVKNIGNKIGKNAYLVLETPSGFKASAMPSQPSYYVGDLKQGETAKAIFYVRTDIKDEGNYTFKVKAVYLNEYGQITESDPVPFGVYVEKAPDFVVKSVESKIFVNAKGDVIVTLTPTADLEDVSVYLTANPPLSVLSTEYYLGDVKAGEEYTAVFKVKASDEAKPVSYPAEIKMKYRSMDEYFYSDGKSIGIRVNPKMKFEVSGIPKIHAGSTEIITFIVKNVGNFTIKEATARLTITDPFSSSDDTAYIGTLRPGESTEVKFQLSVDMDATPKKYGLNLEIKYKDLEGEWAISEPTKTVIEVLPPKPPYSAIALIAIIAIVAIAYYLRRRKK